VDCIHAFMAATAQAQAEATKQAQRAGIDHAKCKEPQSYLGRKPDFTREQFQTARDMLSRGMNASAIAKAAGLSRQSVYRFRDDPARAERILSSWEAKEKPASRAASAMRTK